jgi:hypothetical protein
MSRIFGAHSGVAPLARERGLVLEALDGDVLSGPAIAHRLGSSAGAGRTTEPADQALLYPALYSLEARWKLQAEWLPGADGVRHRTYRRRRLLPGRAGWPHSI